MNACDMAQELYTRGFEIPISEVAVGDLLFYETMDENDNNMDGFETLAFRGITHVGVVSGVSNINKGYINIVECSPWDSTPFSYRNIGSSYDSDRVRAANLSNRVCMVARHPSAFGVESNLGNKFTVV